MHTRFDRLKTAALFDPTLIILHEDHGSHITRKSATYKNAETLTQEDLRAAYSTLFAVRYPSGTFAIDKRALPVAYLVETFMAALPAYTRETVVYPHFRPTGNAATETGAPYIYLYDTFPLYPLAVNIFDH